METPEMTKAPSEHREQWYQERHAAYQKLRGMLEEVVRLKSEALTRGDEEGSRFLRTLEVSFRGDIDKLPPYP